MKVKLVTCLLSCLALVFCMCSSSPLSHAVTDGSLEEPTIPMSVALDSKGHLLDTSLMVIVFEIYDGEKRLIIFTEGESPRIDGERDLNVGTLYWNGFDKYGNPVESGKYTVKMSIFTSDTAFCNYQDIYLNKPSAPVDSSGL